MATFHNTNENTMINTPSANFAKTRAPCLKNINNIAVLHFKLGRRHVRQDQLAVKPGKVLVGVEIVDCLFLGVWQKRPIHNQYFQSQFGRQTSCCNVFVVDDLIHGGKSNLFVSKVGVL